MSKITFLKAYEILDSRGKPTVEVHMSLGSFVASASVPSGASTGIHEACELRDNDQTRFNGMGVLCAVNAVNTEISRALIGTEFDQRTLDQALKTCDGTENKSRLGANSILAVSLAFARAVALERGIELYEYIGTLTDNREYVLPQPMFNIVNGGKHADSGLDIQEFMIIPFGFETFRRKIQAGAEVIHALKGLLHEKGYSISVGDEGGFAPQCKTSEEVFDVLTLAVQKAGYSASSVVFGIDAAASTFYNNGEYSLTMNGEKRVVRSDELITWYWGLTKKYSIMSIEDGLSEDDWDGFVSLTEKLGNNVRIIGDDLLVTNIKRIRTAGEKKAVNSVLIKPNQIGTLSETLDAIKLTQTYGWTAVMSHRSGETNDSFIADLAVGSGCQYIKSGSLSRGERLAKYNRLMEIEDALKNK